MYVQRISSFIPDYIQEDGFSVKSNILLIDLHIICM
jgi:hypothetical protein